jgi:hypothetical protein
LHVRLQLTMPLGARELADHVAREALDDIRLVRHAVRAERHALDAQALEQERGEIDLLELAPAEEAKHDHAPVRRERGDVLVPVRRADEVNLDVRAVPARHALDLLGEALPLVVHARPADAPVGNPDVTKSRLSWLDAIAVTVALHAASQICDGGRGRERRRAGRAGLRRSRHRTRQRG